jgi:hypothetical protein
MKQCKCGSYAFNLYKEDIDQGDLCDVHYWKEKALAQPEQEPVAWLCKRKDGHFDVLTDETCTKCFPVYAHPPFVTWGDQIGGIGFNEPMLNANYKVIATIAPQNFAISRKPLTHEQRFDLLTKFEPHKNKWEASAILIDMVEIAHGIKE